VASVSGAGEVGEWVNRWVVEWVDEHVNEFHDWLSKQASAWPSNWVRDVGM